MSKPTILTVDDDPVVSAAITRDLVGRYGADYRVVGATSGAEALVVLTRLALRDEPVALIAADQRMPEMTGIELLEQARDHAPGAKFLLLTAYADTEVAIRAINDIGLAQAAPADLPLVLVPEGDALRSPSALELAGALGLRTSARQRLYDVCIVGGGPAGLAAAVYAASEGLSTVVVEREAPGGQAGQSAAIENYLGFPKGLSGSDLTQRAMAQAARFGAELVVARDVVGFEARGPVRAVRFDGSGEIEARALIVATGVSYRRLGAAGVGQPTRPGGYYRVNAGEAGQCQGDEVYVVGAANSAGQAALNLSRFATRVVLVVRAGTLADTMSRYLVEGITSAPNIAVRYRSEVVSGRGDGHLEALTLADRDTGVTEEVPSSWLFVFIGASPRTEWLGPEGVRDDKGFVVTGQDLLGPAWVRRVSPPPAPPPPGNGGPRRVAARDVRLD